MRAGVDNACERDASSNSKRQEQREILQHAEKSTDTEEQVGEYGHEGGTIATRISRPSRFAGSSRSDLLTSRDASEGGRGRVQIPHDLYGHHRELAAPDNKRRSGNQQKILWCPRSWDRLFEENGQAAGEPPFLQREAENRPAEKGRSLGQQEET